MGKRPLEGIKVADFGWVAVGPLTTKYLADFGATVVRIESAGNPDFMRTTSPFKDGKPGIDSSGAYAWLNANKYSIALNLKHPSAKGVCQKLVAWSDVVAENFTAGTMEKLGLGYEDLKAVKDDIIMVRSSNQGQSGPHSSHPGLGLMLVGLNGFVHYAGWPDKDPVPLPMAYTDMITPRFAVASLLAALDYRDRTGKGQCIDASQLESGLQFLAPALLDYTVNNHISGRKGNSSDFSAPHGAYRCKGEDRWCVIAVESDTDWTRFKEAIGNPLWANDEKFTSMLNRKRNEEELNKLVESWTSDHSAEDVMSLMQENGVPAGVVKNSADILEDPQLKQRNHIWFLGEDNHAHLGSFFELSKTPAKPERPAPRLGEHTEYVCREFLEMQDEEFIELLTSGVFE